MTDYNRSFELDLDDMEIIEDALRAHVKSISVTEDCSLAEERQMRDIKKVLGRLHDQKVFYRPKQGYIGG